MRLLEPDVGEVIDRLSILEIKIIMATSKGRPSEHFEKEHGDLEAYLNKAITVLQSASGDAWDRFGEERELLRSTNQALWKCEDEIRRLREAKQDYLSDIWNSEVAEVAMRITDLNDVRSKAVGKINALFGVQGQEKIYNV